MTEEINDCKKIYEIAAYTRNYRKLLTIVIDNYSGPEGARVKVSPLFFLIIFGVLNFLNGYKA